MISAGGGEGENRGGRGWEGRQRLEAHCGALGPCGLGRLCWP